MRPLLLTLLTPALALLLVLVTSGCSMTTLQRLNVANETAAGLTKVVIPAWDKKCMAAADKCNREGITVKAKCQPLVKCQAARRIYYHAVNGVHTGVAAGAPLAVLDRKSGADKVLVKVLKALAAAHSAARKAGFLEVLR